jgi:drug/metabolite transporter (DMT)-like permease
MIRNRIFRKCNYIFEVAMTNSRTNSSDEGPSLADSSSEDPSAPAHLALRRPAVLGFWLAIIAAILLSTKAIFVKLAFRNTGVDPSTLLALRMLMALPFYLITAIYIRRQVSFTARQWLQIVVLGLFGYYLSPIFDFIGLQYISAGLERLILFTYPTFAVLLNYLIFRQPILKNQKWALAFTYIGMFISYFGEMNISHADYHFFIGSLCVLTCSLAYAIYLIGNGRMVKKVGPVPFTTYAMISAVLGVGLHYLITNVLCAGGLSGGPIGTGTLSGTPIGTGTLSGTPIGAGVAVHHIVHLSTELLLLSALLAIVATVLPTYLFSASIQKIGANNVSIISAIGPVSTILQAHWILGEPVYFAQMAGTALIIVGIWFMSRKSSQK